ncbi:hypothetical protein MP228_012238 [Amoeboaphelidium protococcarum]|nr:hypothetical protein MP228_012238 [Amoeboaphelidium protococcarum]
MMTLTATALKNLAVKPNVARAAFVAKSTNIIGNVSLAKDSSVYYNAVIRGDINHISIGERSNVQDNVCIHVTRKYPTVVGEGVSIGHSAVLHGCRIGNDCLIGMGAVVLDGAQIGNQSLVAANSTVTMNKTFPARSLIMGSPAKLIRQLYDEELADIKDNAARYVEYSAHHALLQNNEQS